MSFLKIKTFFLLFFFLRGFPVLATEPRVEEVQAVAIQYLGFDLHEMNDWKKKAKKAALLPRLQVGIDGDVKDNVRLTTSDTLSISGGQVNVGPENRDFVQTYDGNLGYEVKAVWYLNELLFSESTLSVSREKRAWIQERSHVLEKVTTAYITRKRLRQELRRTWPEEIREKKLLLFDEMTARLDAYTGSWFSKNLVKGGKKS